MSIYWEFFQILATLKQLLRAENPKYLSNFEGNAKVELLIKKRVDALKAVKDRQAANNSTTPLPRPGWFQA